MSAEDITVTEEDEQKTRQGTAELRKTIDDIMRTGSALVRETNGLPKRGAEFELYNSYPSFNKIMRKQEERLNHLMKRLTTSIGCAMRVPNVGATTQLYTECVIEGQDNIAERASTLLEVLQKAERDEIVKVPSYILKAAPTNRKTEAEIAASLKTFSANIGTVLAQKFRERREEAAQMVVLEKPQKTFNITSDNSVAPFASKLKTKHHANEKRSGIVIIDEDQSGRSDWCDRRAETEEEHPYLTEISNFEPPENQKLSAEVRDFLPIAETPLTMVDTVEKLEELKDLLNSVTEFAVDLEHNETRSYLGLTCLIQISTREKDFIVDPFPIWEHVGILNEPFANPKILKVLHGSDNDVLWLQRDFGVHIVNLFDTYVAMKKLKFPKFSLAYLVSRFASVTLDKQYQLADWRARPLRPAMINYAREDTHYLLHCYDVLREMLIKQSTNDVSEVYKESTELCFKVYQKPVFNPKGYMTEIKFRFTLNTRQDYALTHLYKWRDIIAREDDESPQFVLPNHMLLSLSETLPRDVGGIYACCNPLPYYVKQKTGDIFKIILEARDIKLEKLEPTRKDVNDGHESKGIVNDKMDALTSILRSKMDFSHTKFDEEKGELEIDKESECKDVVRKDYQDTLLSVLVPTKAKGSECNVTIVEKEPKMNTMKKNEVIKKLEEFVTPFECYTICMKEKEKKDEEDRIEMERKRKEEENGPKTKFSHLDPSISRKPVFENDVTAMGEMPLAPDEDEEKDSAEKEEVEKVFDESRFSEDQLMSKKALKKRRQAAKRNVDVSLVLGEGSSESDAKKAKTNQEVEDFDYSKDGNSSAFEKRLKDQDAEFDPFHQKLRLKNKSKKMTMKKSSNRQGTINYNKK